MPEERTPPLNASWVVVTLKRPALWTRGDSEIWALNPHRRYIFNQNQILHLKDHINTISDLHSAGHVRPLNASTQLQGAHILIDRYRDRGIGDYLFLGAVLQYIYDLSGATATLDVYGLLDRSMILRYHPALKYGPLAGPVLYDDLPHYTAHWFIESVTEHVEEPDQPNVYDQLYRQIGIDPVHVAPRYKRPTVTLVQSDYRDLDALYATVFAKNGVDLRITPFIVLCPSAYSTLRAAPYSLWLDLARTLASKYHVILVGRTGDQGQLPSPDMSFGDFYQRAQSLAQELTPRVLNLIGPTPLRLIMALISRAMAVVSLDSGLLYVAQACRIPAVSLWGTHPPHSRLQYDPAYMRGAIWKRSACQFSPCFAYAGFPTDKCPRGSAQKVCEVLSAITVNDILEKLDVVLGDEQGARPPPPLTLPAAAAPKITPLVPS